MTSEQSTGTPTLVPGPKLPFGAGFDFLFPFLYALACAVLGIFLHLRCFPIGDIDLETDFYGDLVIAARNLVEGRFSVHDFAWKGPLYSFVLALPRWITGDWYRGAVLLSAVSGGAYLVLAYRLVLRLFDRRVAVLSMTTASLVVEFVVQFHRASTDVLFMLLSLASMTCSLLAGGSLRRHAVAGGLAALAFLTRYNGVFLVLGAALVSAVVNPDGLARRQRAKGLGLYVGAFLLACAPWFIANWMETGRILATRNIENIVSTFYGGPRWQGDPAVKVGSLHALIARDPAYFAMRFVQNLVEHSWKNLTLLLQWPMALIPIAGILGFVIRPPTRRQTSLYLFAAAYWLLMGIVFYTPRFFLPMILPSVAAGFAVVRGGNGWSRSSWGLRRWLQARGRRQVAFGLVVAFMLALVFVQVRRIVAVERMIYARRPLYLLDAAQVLARKASGSRPRILARKGHIAYHAGFEFSPYSTNVGSLEELVRLARSVGADYVAYSKLEYSMLPRLLFLAVADTVPLLREIHRGRSIRVFRLTEDTRTSLSDAERYGLLLANLRAARAQRRPAAIFVACEDLGRHHMQKQEFAAAAVHFEAALEVAQHADGGSEMARAAAAARHNLAGAQLSLGRPDTAIHILQANLEYFGASGSQRDIARTRERLGRAYEIMGRDEEARRERRMARDLYQASGDTARSESLRVRLRTE